jgi:SAM-dependent methyltransferase
MERLAMDDFQDEYLNQNIGYWNSIEYYRPNVDFDVFRLLGLILEPEFGISGNHGERLLDYGCGQGAAVQFFSQHNFEAFGVDVSDSAIQIAQSRYPDITDNFKLIDPEPEGGLDWNNEKFDVITCFQSLYYYSNKDLQTRLDMLYENLKSGGIFYASMIGESSGLCARSRECRHTATSGLREINSKQSRGGGGRNITRGK